MLRRWRLGAGLVLGRGVFGEHQDWEVSSPQWGNLGRFLGQGAGVLCHRLRTSCRGVPRCYVWWNQCGPIEGSARPRREQKGHQLEWDQGNRAHCGGRGVADVRQWSLPGRSCSRCVPTAPSLIDHRVCVRVSVCPCVCVCVFVWRCVCVRGDIRCLSTVGLSGWLVGHRKKNVAPRAWR